ncbi:hypothetical protein GCM10010236_81150 [Streptomyces eurythermus]|nr:hypothetical protein GCM10010236_81150 [Streptomyces eurythermus]
MVVADAGEGHGAVPAGGNEGAQCRPSRSSAGRASVTSRFRWLVAVDGATPASRAGSVAVHTRPSSSARRKAARVRSAGNAPEAARSGSVAYVSGLLTAPSQQPMFRRTPKRPAPSVFRHDD